MKTDNTIKFFFFLFLILGNTSFAQVGINTNTPEGALDISSTDTGVVLPRIANIGVVANPQGGAIAEGTMVYVLDEHCIKGFTNGAWVDLSICTAPRPTNNLSKKNSKTTNSTSHSQLLLVENP